MEIAAHHTIQPAHIVKEGIIYLLHSGHRKLLCELSKLSKYNVFNLLGYNTNTDASILVHKFHPGRTGFNMYAKYTQLQLTFLALQPRYSFSIKVTCAFQCRKTLLNLEKRQYLSNYLSAKGLNDIDLNLALIYFHEISL